MIVHSSKNPLIIREAVSNSIIEENKTTIKKIADKIFPIASKILDKVTKESGFKYLCDKKYITYSSSYVNMYDENNEDSVNEFGTFTLFEIAINKVLSSNNSTSDDFDWNKWEDALFKLCKELNSNKEISKYGKAYTEQPDDGDQINFKIDTKYLIIDNNKNKEKTGLNSLDKTQKNKITENIFNILIEIVNTINQEIRKENIHGGIWSNDFNSKNYEYTYLTVFVNDAKTKKVKIEEKDKVIDIIDKIINDYRNKYDYDVSYKISFNSEYSYASLVFLFKINDDNYMNFLK